ncbi:hypothetical protein BS47DRAFT_1370603 [Hydnum rufescens UP504]|uniref:Cytokinesis protein sepA n=1 Tax=Hydnum rufescens UP504 TaxID=1448309 RepID=A0A9P6DZU3_9AGAM|nr:hypothetical protein BS47DRAFT_1370603 [Hydnum rufescens UP504]
MESIFGRKKSSRPRGNSVALSGSELDERSVPYDKLAPSSRSPIPVQTLSQAMRQGAATASFISAPITNPTLTTDGTDLNIRMRDRFYRNPEGTVNDGPSRNTRTSTSDSHASSNPTSLYNADSASIVSGSTPSSTTTTRPSSSMTVKSDGHRTSPSKYGTVSNPSSGSDLHVHLPHFHLPARSLDEFVFPRPENPADIEALFSQVKSTRGMPDNFNPDLDQKWMIEERAKIAQVKRQTAQGQNPTGVYSKDSPEWYLKKFMDMTVNSKHVASLAVSLRTLPLGWLKTFVDLQGVSVLATALNSINRKGANRREADTTLEYEILKCLKILLNDEASPYGANDAVNHNLTINFIACSLSSSHLPSRRLVLDMLTFLCYYGDAIALTQVLAALDALSVSNNETGRFDYWFRTLDATLSGRGKMGSLVGASDEVRRNAGVESSLNDYAQSNIILIVGILRQTEDFEMRMHYRSQMETAGLGRILERCKEYNFSGLDKQLAQYHELLEDDQRQLMQNFDQDILRDMSDPFDVYRAIMSSVEGTQAFQYFLSAMQHLLLLREEGDMKNRYFQLIDSLVTSVVLDKKQAFSGGLSNTIGLSVERLVAQFGEQERAQAAEKEATEARVQLGRLKLEKEALEEELASVGDGLVGNLKEKLAATEEKLRISRLTTEALQAQVAEQQRVYEEQIQQLELQISELFKMLKESRGFASALETSKGMDRKELIYTISKQMERKKTIGILEGRHRKKKNGDIDDVSDEGSEVDDNAEETEQAQTLRQRRRNTRRRVQIGPNGASIDGTGRTSQFMDAEEERVRLHIEESLAAGAELMVRSVELSHARAHGSSPRRPGGPRVGPPANGLLQPYLHHSTSSGSTGISRDDRDSEYDVSRDSMHTASDDTVPTSASSMDALPNSKNPLGLTFATGPVPLSQQLANKLVSMGKTLPPGAAVPTIARAIFANSAAPPPPPPAPPPPPVGFISPIASVGSPPPPPPPPLMSAKLRTLASPNSSLPTSARSSLSTNALQGMLNSRKDVPIHANQRMKQLQWDKLPQQQAAKTLWSNEAAASKEKEWISKLQSDGVWQEMEEGFKAKQLVLTLVAARKRAELKSVLDPQTKKRVEIIIQRVKKLTPEEIALRILHHSSKEMKDVLPSPEQVGKLNVYRNSDPEELATLHLSDRLMVQLIKIDRLGPRLEGMLYKAKFEESFGLSSKKLVDAGKALQDASAFKELLSLILLIGNFMNGAGIKGGAFGFRVSSINKLVDTKSVNNTTLLHFLERTVAKHFPAMENFLDELEAPADAYRVNLQDVRKDLMEMRDGLKRIRLELGEHFTDVEALQSDDRYGKKMWRFVAEGKDRLADLVDQVTLADATFTEMMTSSEFYGIFKTFRHKCKTENQTAAEERANLEKRRQQAEQARATRAQASEGVDDHKAQEDMDTLLSKLRAGDSVGRKTRRNRVAGNGSKSNVPSAARLVPQLTGPGVGEAADIAKDMLAALKMDGFNSSPALDAPTELAITEEPPVIGSDEAQYPSGGLARDLGSPRSSEGEPDSPTVKLRNDGPNSVEPFDDSEGH